MMTGIIIGLQAQLSGRAGNIIGPFYTGFWTNLLGGVLAGVLIIAISIFTGPEVFRVSGPAFRMVMLSGALGIAIITGISFAISRAGVAAGLAATIFGQFLFGVLSDSLGWGGLDPIPLDGRRILGLVGLGFSVLMLLPRK